MRHYQTLDNCFATILSSQINRDRLQTCHGVVYKNKNMYTKQTFSKLFLHILRMYILVKLTAYKLSLLQRLIFECYLCAQITV